MTEQVSQKAIFDAIAHLLDEERAITDAAIACLDGNALLKTASAQLADANLRALMACYSDIGVRRSVKTGGEPPEFARVIWEKGVQG